MRKPGVAALLLLCALPSGGAEWEFVGDLEGTGYPAPAVADPWHGRLLLGVYGGYWIYLPATDTWLVRAAEATASPVHSFLSSESDSLALLTGRESVWWSGFIMDNTGLTTQGPIVAWGSWGSVRGLGKTPGPPEAMLACTDFSGAPGVILRSLDGGLSWDIIRSLGWTGGHALSVAPDGDVLVGYGVTQEPWALHGLLRSTDAGESWQEISGDMPCAAHIGDVAIDPLDSQHLYVRQGGYGEPEDPALGVWETLDGGQHWEQILQGNIFDLSMHPDDADVLVAAEENAAVLLTRDGGESWTNVTGPFPSWAVEFTVISRTDERIYVVGYTTEGLLGMWATDLYPTGVSQAPRPDAILAAHPNPFNPATALKFSLREEAAVSVFVTDVQGRRVRSLVVRESRPAGEQSLAWDGRDDRGARCPAACTSRSSRRPMRARAASCCC
ncbi:hypothetical protein FJ251_13815 [bacterium]|nr:hypothetical protein [bacterium]